MGEALTGFPVGQVSAGALVALVVLLILTGRLVPRQQMLDLRADRDKWQTSADGWQRAHHELGMAVEKLLTQGEATVHALTEIQNEMTRPPGGAS